MSYRDGYAATRVMHRPAGGLGDNHRTDMRGDMLAPDFAGGGASCTGPGVDPEQFHPFGDTSASRDQADRTIATYCTPCPMREACFEWGRRYGRGVGIWGGVWFRTGEGVKPRRKGAA